MNDLERRRLQRDIAAQELQVLGKEIQIDERLEEIERIKTDIVHNRAAVDKLKAKLAEEE
jgi:hypothetical protein